MLGYFDPRSIRIGQREATLDFIPAADASKVETVRVVRARQARGIARALRRQATGATVSPTGPALELTGVFEAVSPTQGVLDVPGKGFVPVQLAMPVSQALPRRSQASVRGALLRGALIVDAAILRPFPHSPRSGTAPGR